MKKQRIEINGIVNDKTKQLELFQNKTIRPTIKTQHDILISHFKDYLFKRKIDFSQLTEERKKEIIDRSLSKDIAFKNQILGIIIGQYTIDEISLYHQNSTEYNKRILQISKQRLLDSLSELA